MQVQQARVVPATWRVPGGSIGDCYSYRTSIVYDQAGGDTFSVYS